MVNGLLKNLLMELGQGKIGNGVDSWSELQYALRAPVDPGTYNDWNKLWGTLL